MCTEANDDLLLRCLPLASSLSSSGGHRSHKQLRTGTFTLYISRTGTRAQQFRYNVLERNDDV
jgi:hypothetical protein